MLPHLYCGMGKRDARVDAYIEEAAEFARPILKHLRKLVHHACPNVEETIKWNVPAFTCKGPLCLMAAFKNHAAFVLQKAPLILQERSGAMGSFGRLTSRKDLPDDQTLLGYIRKGVELNEAGIKAPRPASRGHRDLDLPDFFVAALRKNPKAASTFEKFSYSHKKEYVDWLSEAKREETRARRLATTMEWLVKGKPRSWKYERKASQK